MQQTGSHADSKESATNPDNQTTQQAKESSGLGQNLLTEAKALVNEYRKLARDHLRLAAIETRQAGESIVRMVISGVVAGGVAFIGWASLVGAAVAWIVEQGWLSVSLTLLICGVFHLVILLVLAYVIRKQGRGLLFSAIVHELDPRLTGEVSESQKPASMEAPERGNPAASRREAR